MKQPELLRYNLGNDVVAFSTTRKGGYSTGKYAEFNITHYCNDDPEAVRKNREALCQLLGIGDDCLILPRQTHQTEVLNIDEAFLSLSTESRQQALEGIDALVTGVAGVCIGVSTADCIPVLLYDREMGITAAIHAGWRGTVARIAEKAVASMTKWYGSHPRNIVAQVGPGISLDSFEVGEEVYEAFRKADFDMEPISCRMPKPNGGTPEDNPCDIRWHIDLHECNRLQLLSCGVPERNIFRSGVCTYQQHERFFSARRMGIQSGRIFTGIMMK